MNNVRMMTNDELLKRVKKYRELVEILIDRSNYTQIERQTLYYLLSIDDFDRLIDFTSK